VTQSASTYNSIKNVLESDDTPYVDKAFSVFLQGSYGNDTNIYAESDVDIVIQLNSMYYYDLDNLPEDQKNLFKSHITPVTYNLSRFKSDVIQVLTDAYGSDVVVGEKAIQIAARNNRRKADVIVASQYRKFNSYLGVGNQRYIEGIKFITRNGVDIVNYPKTHSENLTTKHQATGSWFKPSVRIFKNIRKRMVEEGMINSDTAPSYFLEGLLYNVPNAKFGLTYESTMVESINWVLKADRSKFVCANEQYYLLHDTSPITWRAEKCNLFLERLVEFWKR
jgi:hypothetical protein